MKNEFFPEDYARPVMSGNYMKLLEGQNKFRVLSSAIIGYEYWSTNNKPVRSKTAFKGTPDDARVDDGKFKQKFFWAFIVWNYNDEKVQILEITQATIQEAIEGFVENEDWGDPKEYDIVIRRQGKDLDTTYSVLPSPKKDLAKEIALQYEEMPEIHLEALYEGADPFNHD